ncbi:MULTISPECIES: hypothetical protein [unclassified Bradyrhizobium]|nr:MULTISPECIES: hypothetical protein [unclassified Bradyrhizobium]
MPISNARQIKDIALPQLRHRDCVLCVPAVAAVSALLRHNQLPA